ncbi:MAG: GNAT family N-acetyltransferase [bacterium]
MATRLETEFLGADQIAAWDALVDRAPHATVFQSTRWTNALADAFGRRGRILGVFRNGVLVGGVPTYERHFAGLAMTNPPVVAGYAGVLLDLPEYERSGRSISETEQILEALVAGVRERFAFARFTHAPGLADTRPFQWAGWRVTPRYTYRIAPRESEEMLASFEHNARKKIRRAEEAGLVVQRVEKTSELISAYAASYRRHRTPPPVPESVLSTLADRLLREGIARAYVVRGADGADHAFQIQIADAHASYAWIAGTAPEHMAEGGFSLMLWKILRDASEANVVFDFMGANTPTIARFKRAFGGELAPYWETLHATRVARALVVIRHLGRG